ncbi:hypothetical protein [Antrihabitans spumae]|uniref:Uncharacterized protein n=1 Tax=Antrihabitans spumae TaxID=3373370 RepID=A0ABW7KFE4_9NOCA
MTEFDVRVCTGRLLAGGLLPMVARRRLIMPAATDVLEAYRNLVDKFYRTIPQSKAGPVSIDRPRAIADDEVAQTAIGVVVAGLPQSAAEFINAHNKGGAETAWSGGSLELPVYVTAFLTDDVRDCAFSSCPRRRFARLLAPDRA